MIFLKEYFIEWQSYIYLWNKMLYRTLPFSCIDLVQEWLRYLVAFFYSIYREIFVICIKASSFLGFHNDIITVLWCQIYTFIDGCRVAFKQSCTCSIKFHKNNKKIKWQQTLHLTYNQILSPIHARKRCLEYRVYNTFYYVHVSLVTMLLIQVSESRLSALINLLPEVSSITNIHQFFSLFKIIILKIFVAWLMICIIIFFLL